MLPPTPSNLQHTFHVPTGERPADHNQKPPQERQQGPFTCPGWVRFEAWRAASHRTCSAYRCIPHVSGESGFCRARSSIDLVRSGVEHDRGPRLSTPLGVCRRARTGMFQGSAHVVPAGSVRPPSRSRPSFTRESPMNQVRDCPSRSRRPDRARATSPHLPVAVRPRDLERPTGCRSATSARRARVRQAPRRIDSRKSRPANIPPSTPLAGCRAVESLCRAVLACRCLAVVSLYYPFLCALWIPVSSPTQRLLLRYHYGPSSPMVCSRHPPSLTLSVGISPIFWRRLDRAGPGLPLLLLAHLLIVLSHS